MSDAVVVVQARMASTRLPGKVLADIAGKPMIAHVMERAQSIGPPVVLATSVDASDDPLALIAARAGWTTARGSATDVLDRFVHALPDDVRIVVRVTGDCPLLDPSVSRAILSALRSAGADYASNTIMPTFPDGLDCEAFTANALQRAWREATRPSDREHVTPYIWRQPEQFHLWSLGHVPNLYSYRWTVDDARDLTFVREVYARLRTEANPTSMYSVLSILKAEPHLRTLNEGTTRNEGYARSIAAEE